MEQLARLVPSFELNFSSQRAAVEWKIFLKMFTYGLASLPKQPEEDIQDDDERAAAISRRRKAFLLTCAGPSTVRLWQTLMAVNDTDNFEETKTKLTGHFDPKHNPDYEVIMFRRT